MKRSCFRSIDSFRSTVGAAATRLRMPTSAYSGRAEMPERPVRRDSVTVSLSLPRQEVMPIPVMTARRM